MSDANARAGASTTPTLSLLPPNVLTIFLARFDVRKGNQIEYQFPPAAPSGSAHGKAKLVDVEDGAVSQQYGVDLEGVEWKVLPSGGHLIDKDTIYFQPAQKTATGVACFRNHKLAMAHEGAAEQRGARMISIGLILRCEENQPGSTAAQQLAIVPHLANLELMADQLAIVPEQTDILNTYYNRHAWKSTSKITAMNGRQMKQLRMRRRRDSKNLPYDPISHMPALCASLGALLPHLLKRLMISGHRLLIFSPAPPLVHAAYLGYNLADLVAVALGRSAKRSPAYSRLASTGSIHVKGQIGVHDIVQLEKEDKIRQQASSSSIDQSWIAWSTDKILLEKPQLFDTVLDLTPLINKASEGVLSEACFENSTDFARLWRVVRTQDAHGRSKAELQKEKWTTREFATFNELDAQAERHVERVFRVGDDACVSRKRVRSGSLCDVDSDEAGTSASTMRRRTRHDNVQSNGDVQHVHQDNENRMQWRGGSARVPHRGRSGTMSAILTFLRYWIAGWWFLPRHWRYGLPAAYVLPLGIRGDGGVRASILVMPEDESDEDYDEDQVDKEQAWDQEADLPELTGQTDIEADAGNPDQSEWQDQTATTKSSSDSEELLASRHGSHHHLVPPDPLLAAVGAAGARRGSVAESDRKSFSSRRRMSMERSLHARSVSGGRVLDDAETEEARSDERIRAILSDALWMVWSHWTTALVSGLLDILEDRLAVDEHQATSEPTLTFKPADMASLGLSPGNSLDVHVVETLGTRYLQLLEGLEGNRSTVVRVEKGWSLFRWLF